MIKISNLSKDFIIDKNTSIKALVDFTLDINKGEIVSIIGKSGSGKTTLANILLGITKPTLGSIVLNDEITIDKKTKRKQLAKITNYVLSSFQYPDHQLFRPTVKEEILFNSNNDEYMHILLKRFKIDESILDKNPFNLSSGQKRKIILISLLIQKPEVLIFDESTAFLDPSSRREFTDIILEINKELGTTIIFISHNMDDVLKISNRVVLLTDGSISMIDKPKMVIDNYLTGGVK